MTASSSVSEVSVHISCNNIEIHFSFQASSHQSINITANISSNNIEIHFSFQASSDQRINITANIISPHNQARPRAPLWLANTAGMTSQTDVLSMELTWQWQFFWRSGSSRSGKKKTNNAFDTHSQRVGRRLLSKSPSSIFRVDKLCTHWDKHTLSTSTDRAKKKNQKFWPVSGFTFTSDFKFTTQFGKIWNFEIVFYIYYILNVQKIVLKNSSNQKWENNMKRKNIICISKSRIAISKSRITSTF